jgi:uncharacterized protein YndB with AHSA1/START domain
MSIATDERVLTIERVFPATREELFDAWTRPEILVEWWGPEGFTTPEFDLDVRENGAWITTMEAPNGDRHTVSGVYKVIDRPARLVFTWGWRQPDGSRGHETQIEIRFEAVPEGTRQVLIQQRFADAEQRERHSHGWTSSFNDLARLFQRQAN